MQSAYLIQTVVQHLPLILLIQARCSGLLGTLFLFRRGQIPLRLTLALSLWLTVVVFLTQPWTVSTEDIYSYGFLKAMVIELCLGGLTGFITNCFIEVFLMFGQLCALQSGLGFANLYIPQMGTASALSQFFVIVATLIFLELNGHLILIKMTVSSLHGNLLFKSGLSMSGIKDSVLFFKLMFSGSLMLSLALMLAILLSNFTMAIMSRFTPQLHIITFAIQFSLIICFFILYLLFDWFVWEGHALLNEIFSWIRQFQR